jgi:hypothetical protein
LRNLVRFGFFQPGILQCLLQIETSHPVQFNYGAAIGRPRVSVPQYEMTFADRSRKKLAIRLQFGRSD